MSTIEKALNKFKSGQKKATSQEVVESNRFKIPSSPAPSASSEASQIELPWIQMQSKGMLTPQDGRSAIAEEMRMIKQPLLKKAFSDKSSGTKHNNLVMVSSSVPGEGKSFTSINLAISFAMELDKTVLLIDADVAKPSIAKYLDFVPGKGLVDYLLGDVSLQEAFLKTDLPNLTILPAGKQHHYSTELLSSESMNNLLDELSERYSDRIVIFDSPPLLATSEAKVLANKMGQVVIVVEAVKTTESLLKDALSKIPNANITGLILNKSRFKSSAAQYGYGYYGAQDK